MNEPKLDGVEFQFRAKPQAKARQGWMLLVFAVLAGWVVLSGVRSGFDAALLVAVVVVLVLFGIIFTVQRMSSPRDGEVVITLTDSAIEAERFVTTKKSFFWSEILGGRVYRLKDTQSWYLELRVTATPSRPDRLSLVKGVNPCTPAFPLDLLGSADQEKLLTMIQERTGSPIDGAPSRSP